MIFRDRQTDTHHNIYIINTIPNIAIITPTANKIILIRCPSPVYIYICLKLIVSVQKDKSCQVCSCKVCPRRRGDGREDKHPKLASFSTRRYLGPPCKRALTGKRKENTRNDRSLGSSYRRPWFLVSITHINFDISQVYISQDHIYLVLRMINIYLKHIALSNVHKHLLFLW